MKKQVREIVMGTPLEKIARKVYGVFAKKDVAAHDIQTLEVMKRVLKEDSNCIDVGCHRGSFLREMLSVSSRGNHFAFEPIPELYKGLVKSFGNQKNVSVFDVALSDTEGETTFHHVVSNPGYSGLRRRRYDRPNEQVQEIVVKTNLLDNIIKEGTVINFMKVDVEGAELLVFKGGVKTLKANRPVIVFEHGLGGADYYGTGPDEIYEVLVTQCGLHLYLMAEWLENNGKNPLSKQAFAEQFRDGKSFYFMAHP